MNASAIAGRSFDGGFAASSTLNNPSVNGGWLRTTLLYMPLMASLFLGKLSVPPFSEKALSIAYLFIFLPAAFGVVTGNMQADMRRFSFFLVLVAVIGGMQVVRGEPFSQTSLLLFVALHAMYILYCPRGADSPRRAVAFFLAVATFLAWCGIAQYCLQFVVDERFVFPIENLVPPAFVVDGFNMQAPIAYGSNVYRANGIFLAEPSFFSQLMAIAIVAELATSSRWLRIGLFGVALVMAHSGTGIMILGICLPLMIVARRRWDLLLFGGVAIAALLLASDALHLNTLLGRAGEFGSTKSSAFMRFVGGFYLFDDFLWHDPLRMLFGYGAGSYTSFYTQATAPAAEMAVFKTCMEYGLVGAVLYFGFIYYCVFRSPAPFFLRLAIGISFLLNGSYHPFFHCFAFGLLVWIGTAGPALRISSDFSLNGGRQSSGGLKAA